MIFEQAHGFDWDEGNSDKNYLKHSVTMLEAEEAFFNSPIVVEDRKHSLQESRFHLLGKTNNNRKLHITFVFRSKKEIMLIRVISSRDMSIKERKIYEKAI